MSFEHFDDNCPGCRPAILDVETGKSLPDTHPLMVKATKAWELLTAEQRRSYHSVMCQNSRDAKDMAVVQQIIDQIMGDIGLEEAYEHDA